MMAPPTKLLLPAIVLALIAAGAGAQDKQKQPKLYRWVDKEGQVEYGARVAAVFGVEDRVVLI